jgi:translation initiation factor IF-2
MTDLEHCLAKKRISELAKELGVDSKAIIAKIKAEGVEADIKGHMSTVSAGLEATIKEWFSEAPATTGGTAVETTPHVDVATVKKAAKKKAKKADEPEAPAAPAEPAAQPQVKAPEPAPAAPAPAQPPAAAPPQPPATPTVTAPAAPTAAPAPAAPPAPPVVEKPRVAAVAPAAPTMPLPGQARPRPASAIPGAQPPAAAAAAGPTTPPPAVIAPAGPRMQPTAAKLKGPKVVRIEQPEQDLRRPRGPRRPEGAGPSFNSPQPDVLRSTGPARGGGVKRVGGGTDKEKGGDDEAGRSPRRKKATNARKGRSAEAEAWTKGVRGEQDLIERAERLSHSGGFLRQRRREMKKHTDGSAVLPGEKSSVVEISEPITIKDLSAATGIKGGEIIKFLFAKGVMATINATIDTELAMEVAMEHDLELVVKEAQTAEQAIEKDLEKRERTDVRRRPPIVAILGHVDHGKTSLLDKIRSANVAAGEAGGITQHIGAFRTTIVGNDGKEKTVVFLDTPGHQAFTSMRARGASLADIVVLVVAADDGVMPQTIESIAHAKAAGTPIVVALNKIDRPEATEANIRKILGQLAEKELNPVEWGGTTEVMKVSAHTGQGVTDLIEVLDYQAELQELTADYDGSAHGTVIEAQLDPGRGPIARVMVQEGQLHVGDVVVIGRAFGKVRSIMDDRGKDIAEAGPATPVEISGIDEVPDAGDKMYVAESLSQAEEIAEQRRETERRKELAAKAKVTLDTFFDATKADQIKELRIVLKADVQGSVEVLRKALESQKHAEVAVKVLHAAVGGITESDVLLAEASNAVVVGFQVIASSAARAEAERRGVDVRTYRVIYDIIDDVNKALEGMLSTQKREEVLGHAEVRDVFRVSKVGSIAGCYVTDGVVRRNAHIRVTRNGVVVEHDRTLESLKRFKEDAKEVRAGMECGMKIEGYDDIHAGDVLECYLTIQFRPTLSGGEKKAEK